MSNCERLREWAKNIRRRPAKLSDAIPMVLDAANEIEKLQKECDALRGEVDRLKDALAQSASDE